jgi:glycosyltransferase involved in cell wall biosynthesis
VPWAAPLLTRETARATGGAETQVFLLARELARRGVRVALIVFDLPGVAIPATVDGVAISVRPRYLAHERLGKVRETLALWRVVARARAGAIVGRSAGPDVGLVALFAKLLRRRFVFSSAGMADFDPELVAAKRRDRILFSIAMRLADEVVVQTTEQVGLCEERFGRTPRLIRSIAEPAPARAGEPDAFLWAGRLVWYKRPLAFVELAKALPEARFRMVYVPIAYSGAAELRAALEREAAGVPNLELLPQRPRPELLRLLEQAVAIVSTGDFEGMPNVFLEAWARGVPSLALSFDPDGLIEARGLGAFARGSQERLVEAARRLWQERRDQAAVAERCRRYVREQHSAEAAADGWQRVLAAVARSG